MKNSYLDNIMVIIIFFKKKIDVSTKMNIKTGTENPSIKIDDNLSHYCVSLI